MFKKICLITILCPSLASAIAPGQMTIATAVAIIKDALTEEAQTLFARALSLQEAARFTEALELYRQCIDRFGDARAENNTAVIYLEKAKASNGEERDALFKRAEALFKNSASKGLKVATRNRGELFAIMCDFVTNPDKTAELREKTACLDKALEYILKASEVKEDSELFQCIALLYLKKSIILQDNSFLHESLRWFVKAANQNNVGAMRGAGTVYVKQSDSAETYQEKIELLNAAQDITEKAVTLDDSDPEGHNNLYMIYSKKSDLSLSPSKKLEFLNKAIEEAQRAAGLGCNSFTDLFVFYSQKFNLVPMDDKMSAIQQALFYFAKINGPISEECKELKSGFEKMLKECCSYCFRPAKSQCGRCHDRKYCSKKCQRVDWPAHKEKCEKKPAIA